MYKFQKYCCKHVFSIQQTAHRNNDDSNRNNNDNLLPLCPHQQTVMSQMDDEKWAALLENSLTRKEEQKVLITWEWCWSIFSDNSTVILIDIFWKHYSDVDRYILTTLCRYFLTATEWSIFCFPYLCIQMIWTVTALMMMQMSEDEIKGIFKEINK